MQKTKIALIGSGTWATALASVLNRKSNLSLNWYFRNAEEADFFAENGRNPVYLRSLYFSKHNIRLFTDINKSLSDAEIVLFVVPSAYFSDEFSKIKQSLKGKIIVSAIKGLVQPDFISVSEYIGKYSDAEKFVLISGPSHAEEVAKGMQTYLASVSKNRKAALQIKQLLETEFLKVSISTELRATEYLATLKNIYAIAAGIAHGAGNGDNFIAALLSSALAEIRIFLQKLNIEFESTFFSPQLLGDLLATAYSKHSRNRVLGNMLGGGYSLRASFSEMKMVAEGYFSAKGVNEIIRREKLEIDMPILEAVFQVLYNGASAKNLFVNQSDKLIRT